MNIVGEQLYPEISEQIKIRQRIYGSKNRTLEQIQYLNARTSFVKLISSVDVENDFTPTSNELINLKRQGKLNSDSLARDFVLFNGTQDADTNRGRGGIARDGSVLNNAAYGLGGLEFGIRPMPGILSAEIKTENRGSLKTSTVRIKAWNRAQFEIVDLLYLRLGFSVLLEFGNTIYFKNNGNLYVSPTSLEDSFLKGGFSTQALLKKIQELRLSTNGNYDAIYGRVVNYSWSFVEDGSYDITVIIRSIGDVIESLKANVLINDSNIKVSAGEDEEGATVDEQSSIEAAKDKHQIGKLFYLAQKLLANSTKVNGGCTAIYSNLFKDIPSVRGKKHFLRQDYGGNTQSSQYYIRLGSFLAFLENKVIPKFEKGNSREPILRFDYQENTNLIYRANGQLSMDPRICLVNVTRSYPSGNAYTYASEGEIYGDIISNTLVGKVMNIYVNFEFILTKLNENLDPKNKSALVDLLKSILTGISNALGGVNTLEPFIDNDENAVKVIDQTPLPNKDNILSALDRVQTPPTILELYGYYDYNTSNASSAGFVRNFGIKTELTPDMATIITIGAQAAGSVVGEDATALSKLNQGLTDRITPVKTDAETPNTDPQKTKLSELNERFPSATKNFALAANQLGSLNGSIPTWDEENINTYSQLQVDFLSYTNARKAIIDQKASGTTGYIPVSLNLTLDGISGIKIYNSLRVDTSYLPSNYPTTMDFIITGIVDRIENNVWTKDITTVMVPKDPSQGSGGTFNEAGTAGTGAQPSTSSNPRAASRNGSISESKRGIVQKIVNFARQQGITDRERLIALLTVAQAESGITPGRQESFSYDLNRARLVFGDTLRRYSDAELLKYIPSTRGGKGTQETLANLIYSNRYGNGPNEGYKYSGRGMTQITFKGNYLKANENFKKYKLPYNLITNPEILKTNEDADVALLVIGKLEGQFGNKLRPGIKYSENPAAIIATQDGGKAIPASAPLAVYSRALQSVLNTPWILDLIG